MVKGIRAQVETEYDLGDRSKTVVLFAGHLRSLSEPTMPPVNFDGWPIRNVIAHLLDMAKPLPAEETAPLPGPEPESREWLCQSCGYTLTVCQCEEGPY